MRGIRARDLRHKQRKTQRLHVRRSAALLIALLLAPLAPAQDAEPPAKKPPAIDAEDLAKEQEQVGRRLEKIEETMRRITKILEARNPDQAARLKIAWQRSKDEKASVCFDYGGCVWSSPWSCSYSAICRASIP